MKELERTFLAKEIPASLEGLPCTELLDVYIPRQAAHAHLRLRKKGERYELTKKMRFEKDDASNLIEQTIDLSLDEFRALEAVEGKRVRKLRYRLDHEGLILEIDVFQDDLRGLVLIDVEFSSLEAKAQFKTPNFALVEVTQDDNFAGGMLCGKKYSEIEPILKKYGYKKLA